MDKAVKIIMFLAQRALLAFIVLGSVLFLTIDKEKLAGNLLAYTKDYGEYAYLYAYGQKEWDADAMHKSRLYYHSLLSFVPSPALVYGNLGFCDFHLGEMGKAVDHYQKAVQLEPRLYSFYYDLGVISQMAQNPDGAAALFTRSLELLPQKPQDFLKLLGTPVNSPMAGVGAELQQLWQRAQYDREQIYRLLADIYSQAQDYPNAQRIALEGVAAFPANAELFYSAGLASYHLKQYARAVELLTAAVRLDPHYAEAYYYRAQSYKEFGQTLNMQKDIQMAMEARGKPRKPVKEDFSQLHVYRDAGTFFKLYGLRRPK